MRILIISAFLLVAGGPVAADMVADLRCREIAFSQSVENGDIETFRSFLDADARFVGSTVLRGPEAIVSAWSIFFADDGPEIIWRPQFVEVLESGDLALTRGPYRVRTKGPDGEVSEEWGTFNSVWRKDAKGTWRVIFDAGNASDTAPPDEARRLLDQAETCRGNSGE